MMYIKKYRYFYAGVSMRRVTGGMRSQLYKIAIATYRVDYTS